MEKKEEFLSLISDLYTLGGVNYHIVLEVDDDDCESYNYRRLYLEEVDDRENVGGDDDCKYLFFISPELASVLSKHDVCTHLVMYRGHYRLRFDF